MESAKKKAEREVHRWLPEDTRSHLHAFRQEMRRSYEALVPPAFIQHRRTARREALLAARSLLDHAIKRLEEAEKAE